MTITRFSDETVLVAAALSAMGNAGPGASRGANAVGAEARHGLRLRQGGQDIFLQDGHQQCRPAAEGRQESAEGHVVLHRPERTALYAHRPLPGRRRQVHVRVAVSVFEPPAVVPANSGTKAVTIDET